MRTAAVLLTLLSLGACAEVTTFRRPDGSEYYLVNCGSSAKLESCQNAAQRTCPKGFTPLNVALANDPSSACAAGNRQRAANGEEEVPCPPPPQQSRFFTCN